MSHLYVLISECLNGNITIKQANKTIAGEYVSSINEAKLTIDMRKGDYDFIIQKATTISTYWFIDCMYYGQTNDFAFVYNFTSPGVTHEIGALLIASYDLPTTTTMSTPTTTAVVPTNVTTVAPNATTANSNRTLVVAVTLPITVTSTKPSIKSTTIAPPIDASTIVTTNMSLPYICSNTSLVPPDPNKTYGYFYKKIHIRG